jgi:hypothetical protein
MIHPVLPSTGLARREAVAVVAAAALLEGAEDLAVCHGKRRIALQVLRGTGSEDGTEGGHGRSPCIRELRRS